MTPKQYFKALVIFLLGLVSLLLVINIKYDLSEYTELIIVSILGMAAINYYPIFQKSILDKNTDNKDMKLLAFGMKKLMFQLVFAVAVVGFYNIKVKPETGHFVMPFVIIYIAFMMFDTYQAIKE